MSSRRSRGFENHQARTLSLQILFEMDIAGHNVSEILRRYVEDDALPQPVRNYSERLVQGVVADLESIDDEIGAAATSFPVAQLPAVDRNILRVAIYELREEHDVPLKAVINEAVDLAKLYGGEKSGRFVNGVLGTLSAAHRRAPASD